MVTPSMRKALEENPKHKAFLESLAPIERFSDPHDVAEAVIWLCSDKASFVIWCASGQCAEAACNNDKELRPDATASLRPCFGGHGVDCRLERQRARE